MKNVLALSVCFFALAGVSAMAGGGRIGGQPLLADDVTKLTTDLDRDGQPETFEVTDNGESLTTLTIKRPGKPTIVARDMVWSLELASLKLASNGSVLLGSSHVGVGRSPHEQTLTIAFRGGTYQVVGLTRGNWDRIEPDSSTSCDLNLLTGQGKVNGRPVRRALRAMPVTAWTSNTRLPAGCFIP
jgi:hypothetical protein